jgi:hypothetical protein
MLKKTVFCLLAPALLIPAIHAEEIEGWDLFDWMEAALKGEWVLSPADRQTGTDSYKHPAVLPIIGTDKPGIAFKLIGNETTIQEDLLPDTAKQMVTMYHCKNIACTTLKATHYCVKQNQPEFIANLEESTPSRFVFDCDMSTELCRSDEDHVHRIIHELSEDGNHLKTSYLSWENKKLKERHSIYHFDRKQ